MKFYKRELGKQVEVKWEDPTTYLQHSFAEVKKRGVEIKISIGWFKDYNGKYIYIQSEKCDSDDGGDYTIIHRALIVEICFL